MSRNSSGTFSLASGNPVVSGTTISSTTANTTLTDIATGLTDSLDRQGRGAMLAPLALPNGSSSAPALTFATETGTGWYRAATNDVRLQVAGVTLMRVTATGIEFPLTLAVTGVLTPTGGVVAPTLHYVGGGGGEPAFQNSWANLSTATKAHYFKTAEGLVCLGGFATGGANSTVVFTLPVGYRPATSRSFLTRGSGPGASLWVITIASSGTVTSSSDGGAPDAYLDGITFNPNAAAAP